MLAQKGSTYNGRPSFANPMYLKKAQSEKPCLYEIPYDTSDLANRFAPNREETLTLEQESISKLNKDLGTRIMQIGMSQVRKLLELRLLMTSPLMLRTEVIIKAGLIKLHYRLNAIFILSRAYNNGEIKRLQRLADNPNFVPRIS
ncbi:hypothetical protein Tco_0731416 [Tanacetum coccineum]